MCELGLERGWTDTVCWVHGQLDPCLGSHVKIVDEGKGNVNEHVLNETTSAKALQSSKMISIQACELFLRLVFLEHTAQRLLEPKFRAPTYPTRSNDYSTKTDAQ